MTPIRVGIVGASPDRGWGLLAHVPALRSLGRFRITAVATTREESARAAAEAIGVPHAFTTPADLAACADVDFVVVSVKAPSHAEVIAQVVTAGKNVFVEWPAGRSTMDTETISSLIEDAGVRGFVGLQSRADAVVGWARCVIAEGALGELLAVSVRSARLKGIRGVMEGFSPYTLDRASGAGNTEIHGGHLLDLVTYLVPSARVTTGATSLVRTSYVDADGRSVAATAPDVLSAELRVGDRGLGSVIATEGDPEPGTELVLLGTEGRLELTTDPTGTPPLRQSQISPYRGRLVTADGIVERHPAASPLPVEVRKVAALYDLIAADLFTGTSIAPTLADALAVRRQLDRLRPAITD